MTSPVYKLLMQNPSFCKDTSNLVLQYLIPDEKETKEKQQRLLTSIFNKPNNLQCYISLVSIFQEWFDEDISREYLRNLRKRYNLKEFELQVFNGARYHYCGFYSKNNFQCKPKKKYPILLYNNTTRRWSKYKSWKEMFYHK